MSASLTWTANTEVDIAGYFVYRDTSSSGTFPLRADTASTAANFTDSGDAGATYYYKISAYNTATHESAATGVVSLTLPNATGGASTPASSGGGGSPLTVQITPVSGLASAAASVLAKSITSATAPGMSYQSTVVGIGASVRIFVKNLAPGARGDAVKKLQEFLKSDHAIYPEGLVNGNFGPATLRAVKKFQAKYGITANGNVGPLTRAKLEEVFGGSVATPTPTTAATPASITEGGSASIFVKDLALGSRNDDVRRLQQLLMTDSEIYPEAIINGNFGGATQRAIKRFQAKYGITNNGRVGPLTRAKLHEVFEVMMQTQPAPAPAQTSATSESSEAKIAQTLRDQIAQTIKQIAQLQAAATSTAATTTPSIMATSTLNTMMSTTTMTANSTATSTATSTQTH